MRVFLSILFFFQTTLFYSQGNEKQALSLDEVLACNKNSPVTDSTAAITDASIKSAWYDMLYHIHIFKLLQDFLSKTSDLERIAELKYRSGELDIYETSSLFGILADAKTNTEIAANDIQIDRNRLSIYTGFLFVPEDSLLDLYEIDKTLAYERTFSTDSLSKAEMMASENKRLELDNLFAKIRYYRNYALNHAEIIDRYFNAKLVSEDIDYITLVQSLNESLKIRLEYLKILNLYNQLAIEMEYTAY